MRAKHKSLRQGRAAPSRALMAMGACPSACYCVFQVPLMHRVLHPAGWAGAYNTQILKRRSEGESPLPYKRGKKKKGHFLNSGVDLNFRAMPEESQQWYLCRKNKEIDANRQHRWVQQKQHFGSAHSRYIGYGFCSWFSAFIEQLVSQRWTQLLCEKSQLYFYSPTIFPYLKRGKEHSTELLSPGRQGG